MEKPKIIILAGGKGTRLYPLTKTVPKPLVPLNGKPVIEYLMNLFAKQGYVDFVVSTGYKTELVEEEVKKFSKDSWNVEFVNSPVGVSFVKLITDAYVKCGERFIVCYGDTVADVDIAELLKFHETNNASVTNVLSQMQSPFGLMETSEGLVTSYEEKPLLPYWFNIGFFVFEKEVIAKNKDMDWIQFLKKMVAEKKLFALKHRGHHITFNNSSERKQAEKQINVFSHVCE
ncbi:MAG: nucleotidyltransferase family protein [Candidatus Diapherotrites archaeon]|jgi:glucose-1-phosphate cytidylyltransferase|nr:nucleotidyltransferase family protein [Candidatus Diapherotrites archaeon]MBT4596626.1 nucleotidyltransferase family protein [Candidatus Diapherotrites archaeon]